MKLERTHLAVASLLLATPLAGARGEEPGGENLTEGIAEVREETGVPGLWAMAIQDGEVLAWGAAGVRAAGPEGDASPASIDDPIHLGSCSKAFTATLVARLVEDGVLSWETTIAAALPSFAEGIDEGFHDVTIEELLRHRGGIAERRRPEIAMLHGVLQQLSGTPREVRLEILAKVLEAPPLAPPEHGFDYSNFGYMTAAAMIERVADRPWSELMIEHVFRPFELTSAGIGSPAGPDVPVGHSAEGDEWVALPPGPGGVLPDAMGPAGLMSCNLADWGRFVSAHLAGHRGEDGLLSAETFQRLHSDEDASSYAAGWGVGHRKWSWGEGTVLTHDGSDGTWHSVVDALPEWDLTVLTATNCGGTPGRQAASRARDLLLETLGYRD